MIALSPRFVKRIVNKTEKRNRLSLPVPSHSVPFCSVYPFPTPLVALLEKLVIKNN